MPCCVLKRRGEGGGPGIFHEIADLQGRKFYTPEPLCAGTCAQGFGGVEFRHQARAISEPRGEGGLDLGIRPAQFQGLRPPTAENTARRPRGGAVFSAVSARRPLRIRRGGLGRDPPNGVCGICSAPPCPCYCKYHTRRWGVASRGRDPDCPPGPSLLPKSVCRVRTPARLVRPLLKNRCAV